MASTCLASSFLNRRVCKRFFTSNYMINTVVASCAQNVVSGQELLLHRTGTGYSNFPHTWYSPTEKPTPVPAPAGGHASQVHPPRALSSSTGHPPGSQSQCWKLGGFKLKSWIAGLGHFCLHRASAGTSSQ